MKTFKPETLLLELSPSLEAIEKKLSSIVEKGNRSRLCFVSLYLTFLMFFYHVKGSVSFLKKWSLLVVMLFNFCIFVIAPGVNVCNYAIKLESVITMCDCDIKISTKLCQMQCHKLTQHIQISVDDFYNSLFLSQNH